MLGDYVTLEAGTGAVHTAPGHGADDFNTGMRYGLEIYAPIGPAGHFLDTVELFGGQRVFDANPNVEEALKERGRLWHREAFSHQYPHCWRCHNPVIFLATSQWFIAAGQATPAAAGLGAGGVATLREAALDADRSTRSRWIPAWGHDRIYNMVAQPARLVHLAPARLGRADSGGGLHRRAARRSLTPALVEQTATRVRAVRRRRLVRAADRGVHPATG